MTPTTNDLLMRVLRVESPGLFDGSEYEPMEVRRMGPLRLLPGHLQDLWRRAGESDHQVPHPERADRL